MTKYLVIFPVVGYVSTEVEAEDESSAIAKAKSTEHWPYGIEEWDIYDHVLHGNVWVPSISPDVEVEEVH